MRIYIVLLFAVTVLSHHNESNGNKSRKHYGLSYHVKCPVYFKAFTCMSACKSIGYQVFRMDYKCKCSCHELKTTTILPFFKWRTNGTIQKWHTTQSVPLYGVVGTLSPPTYYDYGDEVWKTTEPTSSNITMPPLTNGATDYTTSDNTTTDNTTTDYTTTGYTTTDYTTTVVPEE